MTLKTISLLLTCVLVTSAPTLLCFYAAEQNCLLKSLTIGLFLLNILECFSAFEVATHKFIVLLDFRIISKLYQLSLFCLHCVFHVNIRCCCLNFRMKIASVSYNLLGPSINQHISNPFGLLNVHKYPLFLWLCVLGKCWTQSIIIHSINIC